MLTRVWRALGLAAVIVGVGYLALLSIDTLSNTSAARRAGIVAFTGVVSAAGTTMAAVAAWRAASSSRTSAQRAEQAAVDAARALAMHNPSNARWSCSAEPKDGLLQIWLTMTAGSRRGTVVEAWRWNPQRCGAVSWHRMGLPIALIPGLGVPAQRKLLAEVPASAVGPQGLEFNLVLVLRDDDYVGMTWCAAAGVSLVPDGAGFACDGTAYGWEDWDRSGYRPVALTGDRF